MSDYSPAPASLFAPTAVSGSPAKVRQPFRPRDEEQAKEAKRLKEHHKYLEEEALGDLGAQCLVCGTLPLDCAMLRPKCSCKILLCFNCFAKHVRGFGVITDPVVVAEPRNAVSLVTDLDPQFLPVNPFKYLLSRCPHCNQDDVKFEAVDSMEWTALRQLYMAIATKERIAPVKIACASHPNGHPSDNSWVHCDSSVFTLKCPALGCDAMIEMRCDGVDIRAQFQEHLDTACRGTFACPFCSREVACIPNINNDPNKGQPKWHYHVSVRQVRTHFALHVQLYALWLSFSTPKPATVTVEMQRQMWWTQACSIFKGTRPDPYPYGGKSAFSTRRAPLDRLVNGVRSKREWLAPWMEQFTNRMNAQALADRRVLMGLAFPAFFNAAHAQMYNYGELRDAEEEDDEEELWEDGVL